MKMQISRDPSACGCALARVWQPRPRGGPGKYRFWLLASGLLPLIWLVAGCQSPSPEVLAKPWSSVPAGARSLTNVCLVEGDAVRVNFEGQTNLNTVVKLQLDGSITMPLVGEVKALGMTPQELQTNLTKLYASVLKPGFEISVSVASTAASVYVSGAVLKPGRIPMERPITVLEAVMEAGGFDFTRAKPSKVTVFRVANGFQYHYRLDLKRMLKGGDSGVFYLQPFDIIYVPEKTFNF